MKTIKTAFIAVIMLMGSVAAYAQPERVAVDRPVDRRKQIEAQKIAFITTELNLTPEEAQVFWPVYNQAQGEQKELRKKQREMRESKVKEGEPEKTTDTMSDSELNAMMDQMLAHEQAELDIKKKYHKKYKEILPVKKVAKLYQTERKFKRKLMSDIRRSGSDEYPNRARRKTKAKF